MDDTRRLGTILLVFGIVGAVLAGVIGLGLVAGAALTIRAAGDVGSDRPMAGRLATLAASIDGIADDLDAVGAARAEPATARRAVAALDDLATSSDSLADRIDVDVLGAHPLEGVAERLRNGADRARSLSVDAETAATAAPGTSLVSRLAGDLHHISAQLIRLAAAVDQAVQVLYVVAAGFLAVGIFILWIAAGAVISAWAGWGLRRASSDRETAG